jgi:hypothetical protein
MGIFFHDRNSPNPLEKIEERNRDAELRNTKDAAAWYRNIAAAGKLLMDRALVREKEARAGKLVVSDAELKELKNIGMALYDMTPKLVK